MTNERTDNGVISEGAAPSRKVERLFTIAAAILGSLAVHSVFLLVVLVLNRYVLNADTSLQRIELTRRTALTANIEENRIIPEQSGSKTVDLLNKTERITSVEHPALKPPDIMPDIEPVEEIVPEELLPRRPEIFELDRLPDPGEESEREDRNAILGAERLAGVGGDSGAGIFGSGGGIGGGIDDMGGQLGGRGIARDILLVWVIDSSPSMSNKIDQLKTRIGPLFNQFNDEQPDRVLMAVVAFDSRSQLILEKPTGKTGDVLNAMEEVKQMGEEEAKKAALAYLNTGRVPPGAGVENVMAAIKFSAHLARQTDRQVVIGVMTDEAGDDAANWSQAWDALKRFNIPLYVFGPATNFVNSIDNMRFEFTDERFIDNKIDPRSKMPRNPTGSVIITANADRGWAMPHREPLASNWGIIFHGVSTDLPGGCGTYYLSKLVMLSGGRYYALDQGVKYFGTPEMAGYMPSYNSDENRRILLAFGDRFISYVKAWNDKAKPPAGMSSYDQVVAARRLAGENLKLAEELIGRVRALGSPDSLPARWQAHRDLFLAELYGARYRLREYLAALSAVSNKTVGITTSGGEKVKRSVALSDRPVTAAKDPQNTMQETIPFTTFKPVELVIRSEEEWNRAVKEHAAYRDLQEKPPVNFQTQMLVVVSGGQSFRPEAYVFIAGVNAVDGVLEVAVDRNLPPSSGMDDSDRVFFPCSAVIVPRTDGAVKFVELGKWVTSKAEQIKGEMQGGVKSAEARAEAEVLLSHTARKYKGTPWAETAQGLLPLPSFGLEILKETLEAPKPLKPPKPPKDDKPQPPPTPVIPGGA
ncbi:MAG: vWA domain-containing protein [Planctomycetota bacterium]